MNLKIANFTYLVSLILTSQSSSRVENVFPIPVASTGVTQVGGGFADENDVGEDDGEIGDDDDDDGFPVEFTKDIYVSSRIPTLGAFTTYIDDNLGDLAAQLGYTDFHVELVAVAVQSPDDAFAVLDDLGDAEEEEGDDEPGDDN